MGSSPHSAALIIRVWFDGDPPAHFRARMVEVVDSSTSERTLSPTVDPEDVYAAVRSWVQGLTTR